MPKKKNEETESTELAKPEGTGIVTMGNELDELDALLDDAGIDEEDGLVDEIDPRDLKLPIYVWNLTSLDSSGKQRPKDEFFNVITEDMFPEIDAVLLVAYKTNVYREKEPSGADGRRKLICLSMDTKTGRMRETGLERACETCPDGQWRKGEGEGGKDAPPRCRTVYNTVWIDRKTQDPFVIRFKGAAYQVFTQHLQRYVYGKRKTKVKLPDGTTRIKRVNMPLFVYSIRLTLKMVSNAKGTFAVPVFGDERELPRLDGASIRAAQEAAKYYKETVLPAEREKIAQVEFEDGESSPGSTDQSDFSDGGDVNDDADDVNF